VKMMYQAGVLLLLLLVPAAAVMAEEPPPTADALLDTRSFVIRHKDPDDVVSLIRPALSDDASVLIQSKIGTLTVTDHAARLDGVEALIAGFDLPPRDVSMTINLLRGTRGAPGSRAGLISSKVPPSLQQLTRWLNYELLGGMTLQASEGESSSLLLGEEYRVRFAVATVDDRSGRVRLKSFILERRVVDPQDGETYVALFDTVVNLKSGIPYVFGATRGQNASAAIFLAISADIAP
jgi:hypothetical protein